MISHLNSFRYMELDGEFIETPFQHFEEVSPEVAVAKTMTDVPIISKPVYLMESLKDAEAVVKEEAQYVVNCQIFLSRQISSVWVSLLLARKMCVAPGLEDRH